MTCHCTHDHGSTAGVKAPCVTCALEGDPCRGGLQGPHKAPRWAAGRTGLPRLIGPMSYLRYGVPREPQLPASGKPDQHPPIGAG
eukprot:3799895-Pyramimonas_sp.AAC.2